MSALDQARKGWAGAPPVAAIEADLAGPPLPDDGAHVWDWYQELDQARGSNGFGPAAISWQEIAAWAGLTGRRPMAWECAALMILDRLYRAEWGRQHSKPATPPAKG